MLRFFFPFSSPTHEKLRSAIADSKITFSNIETEKFERESPQMASVVLNPLKGRSFEKKNTIPSWWLNPTPLKHIRQIGSFPQMGLKIKNL